MSTKTPPPQFISAAELFTMGIRKKKIKLVRKFFCPNRGREIGFVFAGGRVEVVCASSGG